MNEIVREKYNQHRLIKENIKDYIGLEIVETKDDDSFWGRGPDKKVKNNLSRLWII